MLYNLIRQKTKEWFASPDCTVNTIVDYIRNKGFLRDTQIEAVETYLFLKIKGENKPLWQLFAEGFFSTNEDLEQLNINVEAREYLNNHIEARALFEFSRLKSGNSTILPELEKYILNNSSSIEYHNIIKEIFYNVNYTDYLFSLPMGAGKTYLMAAFIYLDLYFAINEPSNKNFAHNFIVLVPSGLKSSIIPSLKTIENFNPEWVLPNPSGAEIKRLLKFEILDQQKSAKKSNKARNPNVQKIAQHQPFQDLMGLIMIVNAEKVILDRLELSDQNELIEKTDDEKDKYANELRNLIGKIPNLSIHIDEVHHATSSDIKLRQIVNNWNNRGTINNVLGYSGTPYMSSKDKITIHDDLEIKFSHITNTVYYYSLVRGIKNFLKKPTVKVAANSEPLQIIERGIKDFYDIYGDTIYENGTIAKLAIYCGNIERLEEEIFPFLTGSLNISQEEILKYHKGNKTVSLPKENEIEFNMLDSPLSKKKIILLVQIGKEGWDCKSLTGVILAQKGDSPTNMVLQTSCRCLRQVDKNSDETAIIWLNDYNADKLNKQLKDEQNTSIDEINKLGKNPTDELVKRHSRIKYLQIPDIKFYQLKVTYNTLLKENDPNTENKLSKIEKNKNLIDSVIITERGLNPEDIISKKVIETEKGDPADFNDWLLKISKNSFNFIHIDKLKKFENKIKVLFDIITFEYNGKLFFNNLYNISLIESLIRISFYPKRELEINDEIIPQDAHLLLVEKLKEVNKHDKLYPSEKETEDILKFDESERSIDEILEELDSQFSVLKEQGMLNFIPEEIINKTAIRNKNNTFHYIPYDFRQSRFELNFLKEVLTLNELQDKGLEIYYNGEKEITDFVIRCYSKHNNRWKNLGKYTPDFLILKRKDNQIYKVMIVETKGTGFANQPGFVKRKEFVEGEFLKMNNDKFGYDKFNYLYISDGDTMNVNLTKLNSAINKFF